MSAVFSNHSARRVDRHTGFTLVEILMVVAILGIITTIVGVSVGSRDDMKVASSARVLVSNLQYLQNRAVVQRQPQYVQVGSGGNSLNFVERQGTSWQTLTHPVDPGSFAMVFGSGGSGGGDNVTLEGHFFDGNAMFGFDETGAPIFCDGTGANRVSSMVEVTFTLKAGDFASTIRVQPITGEISVDRP